MGNEIKGQLSGNGWETVTSEGVMGARLTTGGATLFSVLDADGSYRVYAAPEGQTHLSNPIARGNLADHATN